jgi:hypothetical protein
MWLGLFSEQMEDCLENWGAVFLFPCGKEKGGFVNRAAYLSKQVFRLT